MDTDNAGIVEAVLPLLHAERVVVDGVEDVRISLSGLAYLTEALSEEIVAMGLEALLAGNQDNMVAHASQSLVTDLYTDLILTAEASV